MTRSLTKIRTPECYSYKHFQTYSQQALRVFLYHIRPSQYVKNTRIKWHTKNCHTPVLNIFYLLLFQTTYLKIGASICCSSFTKHLYLYRSVHDSWWKNCLSLSNTLQSRYYTRGLYAMTLSKCTNRWAPLTCKIIIWTNYWGDSTWGVQCPPSVCNPVNDLCFTLSTATWTCSDMCDYYWSLADNGPYTKK